MKLSATPVSRHAFTLVELMFAISIGLVVAGSAVMLIYQSAREQRRGLAAASVEAKSHLLQSKISACLRSASGNQGITPDYSTKVLDSGGNILGYQTIIVFAPTNGGYVSGRIRYTAEAGSVVYTPNVATAAEELWMTNSASCRLTNFLFNTSFNLDGSINSSLVNVSYLMDDNNYSTANQTNNPASILRSFSIQMRND
jgi:prepilin-type N-terminal cleavage/methylation domain-containing protein